MPPRPRPGLHRRASFQAFFRPQLGSLVTLGHRRCARGQHDPRLLRGGEDVDVGWQAVGLVERADADEANGLSRARVVAPDGHPACRAASDALPLACSTACRPPRPRRAATARARSRSWRSARTTRRSRAGTSGSGSSGRRAARSSCGSGSRGRRNRRRGKRWRPCWMGNARARIRRVRRARAGSALRRRKACPGRCGSRSARPSSCGRGAASRTRRSPSCRPGRRR